MKMALKSLTLVPLVMPALGGSPIGKVLSMISDLQAKIIQEGEVVQKEYTEFAEWCEDRASNLGFEIKTGKSEVSSLSASIDEETATIQSLKTKVDELTASITTDEADLKAATHIREIESADFQAEDSELSQTIDMLRRASGIIEREMQGGASMLQFQNMGSVVQALTAMVQASLMSSGDVAKLSAFIQQQSTAEDDDQALGAPAGSVYDSHSGDILSTLEDLTEKAEKQLDELRNTETTNKNNYQMLKQSLEDEIRFANKELSEANRNIAASSEKKSTAEGDLAVTNKDLSEDIKAKASLHHDCMEKSAAFEAETKSRGEELKALATAKKVIEEATGVSLLQTRSKAALAQFEVVRKIRDMGIKMGSGSLVQLATQVEDAMHARDPFAKVKGLISDMIAKLEDEAGADANKKAYCDKELSETNVKKEEKTAEIKKLSTRMDQASAKSATLKEEVAALQNELSKLAKAQAEMDRLRQEEKTNYVANKAELEKGLEGIKLALKVLNEYYAKDDKAHEAAEGTGSSIIGLLEVIEADFSKNLAQAISDEEMAVAEWEQETKENEIEKTTKEQDVKYKIKESKRLDKYASELSADLSGVQAELDAVLEYLSKIEGECIAKAETYAERKARFESEIAGLKEALNILESETALIQQRTQRVLRGSHQF